MLPIYICEDNPEQLALLTEIIEKAILIEELDMQVVCRADTPQELLCHLSAHSNPALYFLDVHLNGEIQGFQLAQRIREYDPRGFIVFITTYSELSLLAFEYQVEAMDYIVKDSVKNMPERIKSCMLKAAHLYTSSTGFIHRPVRIKVGGKYIFLSPEDIYSIETFGEPHRIRVYEKSGYSDFFYTLSDIMTDLPECFYKCHKSCIVNLNHVKEISMQNRAVIMTNGRQCPVSNRCFNTLCKKSCNYSQEYYNK